jgi:short-subunit dehydrogenase
MEMATWPTFRRGSGCRLADVGGDSETFSDRYGGWALITGASSGIGRAMAGEVAARGMPCVILSNDQKALERARDELLAAHRVEVEALCLDLAEPDVAGRIRERLGGRELGLLVSNASFGRTGAFGSDDMASYRRMLAVNVDAYVALTHEFVPDMVARGRGGVVVVSSLNSLVPGIGGSAVYSATKAFETSFACGLWHDLLPTGVDVLLVIPGPTRTGFQEEAGTKVASWAMDPETVAAGSLPALGKRLVHVAGEVNQILAGSLQRLALEPRVEIASWMLDEALIKGNL